jgi:hypothetical protein
MNPNKDISDTHMNLGMLFVMKSTVQNIHHI